MHMMREAHFETVFKRLDYPRHYFAKETFLYDVMYPYDVGIKERIRGISKMRNDNIIWKVNFKYNKVIKKFEKIDSYELID